MRKQGREKDLEKEKAVREQGRERKLRERNEKEGGGNWERRWSLAIFIFFSRPKVCPYTYCTLLSYVNKKKIFFNYLWYPSVQFLYGNIECV